MGVGGRLGGRDSARVASREDLGRAVRGSLTGKLMRISLTELWRRRRWRLAFTWTAALVALGGIGALGYRKLVEGAWIQYNKWDHRERGGLRVGQPAPDLELPLLDQGTVHLAELWRERPVVLVFGSCT